MKKLFFVLILVVSTSVQCSPEGYLWYNQKKTIKEDEGVKYKELSSLQKRNFLVFQTKKAIAEFDVSPTPENALKFIRWQHFWLQQTTKGKRSFQEAMYLNPEYDYTVTHPTSATGTRLRRESEARKLFRVIKKLSSECGLIYFYRGNNSLDVREAKTIKDFAKQYHFHLTAISVDGKKSNVLKNSYLDYGQSRSLGIKYYPSVYLANPKKGVVKAVSRGFVTQDVLLQQLMMLATNFKGDGL